MPQQYPVLSQLLAYVNNADKSTTQTDLAQALLDHYHLIPTATIHEMAELCYVSSATLSRFIRQFGYESYPAFKEACQTDIAIDVDYSFPSRKAGREDLEPIFQRYLDNTVLNLQEIISKLDYDKIDRLCRMMYEARQVGFFGLEFSTLIGQHFQIKMASCNKLIKIGRNAEKQLEIASNLDGNCLAIVASVEGSYFYHDEEVINKLRENQVPIVTMTGNVSKIILRSSELVLELAHNNLETEGRISLLFMLELILMMYYINYRSASL